jgi:ABC-2 type transport system ATP-binding protein
MEKGPSVANLSSVDTPGTSAITVHDANKTFGSRAALTSVSFTVPRGVFYGLVGPNGAGKTTLLRAITGLQAPDTGDIAILGRSVWPNPLAIRPITGMLPDDLRLLERLSGRELLSYCGLIRRLDPVEVKRRADQLLDVLGFGVGADELVADYSTGMRKKIALAAAMIHAPGVLVLDEPFESVDPISVRSLVDVLRAYQRAGGTVLLSSHVMDTVEKLCSHVAILHGGKVLDSGPIDEVTDGVRLEDRFIASVGGTRSEDDLSWLTGKAPATV